MGYAEPLKLGDAGARVLPLFPDDGPQPASDPVVNGSKTGGHLGVAEISPPASGEGVKPGDDLLDAQPTVSRGELPHPLLKPLDGFRVDANLRVIPTADEAESEKRPPPWMADDALSPVDFQPETGFNVTDEAQTAFLQLFVKLVQHDVGQER